MKANMWWLHLNQKGTGSKLSVTLREVRAKEISNPALTVIYFFQRYTFFNKTILASPYKFIMEYHIQIATGRNYYTCNVQARSFLK